MRKDISRPVRPQPEPLSWGGTQDYRGYKAVKGEIGQTSGTAEILPGCF